MPPVHVPSAPFDHPAIEERFTSTAAERRSRTVTIFNLAFAPTSDTDDRGGGTRALGHVRYLLGCSSNGKICFWNLDRSGGSTGEALATLSVTNSGPLYDMSFIEMPATATGDANQSQHVLAASGRGGVTLYRWPDIWSQLNRCIADVSSAQLLEPAAAVLPTTPMMIDVQPFSTLHLHPNPRAVGSIHCTSYNAALGILYGASDDGFGTYAWDVSRGRLLGTLAPATFGAKRSTFSFNSFHHTVQALGDGTVVAAGDNGVLEIWDGKLLKVIETIDCASCIREGIANQLVSADSGRASSGRISISTLYVSSCGNWAALGGECVLSARKVSKRGSGFVSLFHLPTRSLSSAHLARECIQDIQYDKAAQKIVTVGNEGAISFWNESDLSSGRAGRAWITTPNAYSVAIDDETTLSSSSSGVMVVGGTGSTVDCFANGNKAFELTFSL